MVELHLGDCLEVMAGMEPNSVDTVITDPPYGLEFMGKDWDHGLPGVRFWKLAYRVAKPGAMLLAFGGTRTHHRLMCGIEDAGWEIRDCLFWIYGQGFPKSFSLGKATGLPEWEGYGTALKPAVEPIVLAMKPRDGTFANNALEWGVAGLWIDGARIPTNGDRPNIAPDRGRFTGSTWEGGLDGSLCGSKSEGTTTQGRWPANLILSHHAECDGDCHPDCPVRILGEQSGERPSRPGNSTSSNRRLAYGMSDRQPAPNAYVDASDTGTAARFFYTSKASRRERTCDGTVENGHPTVKSLDLMRYLCRLTNTPTGGIVLDPFMGSGTTGMAAIMEGREFIGIELDADYHEIARRRIEWARGQVQQLELCL